MSWLCSSMDSFLWRAISFLMSSARSFIRRIYIYSSIICSRLSKMNACGLSIAFCTISSSTTIGICICASMSALYCSSSSFLMFKFSFCDFANDFSISWLALFLLCAASLDFLDPLDYSGGELSSSDFSLDDDLCLLAFFFFLGLTSSSLSSSCPWISSYWSSSSVSSCSSTMTLRFFLLTITISSVGSDGVS